MLKKRLKLRFSRVISPFQSCRPKDGTAALPPIFRISPQIPKKFDTDDYFPTPPRPSPAVVSPSGARCRCSPSPAPSRLHASVSADIDADDLPAARGTPAYLWRKEEKWHVVSKIDRKSRSRSRISCSSTTWFSDEEIGGDEKEEEESHETDALIEEEEEEERKVEEESFAVVKRSEDPRGDFRRSMAEMVVEKGIYDAAGLEKLLHCFLSINSRRHHRAIVSAFKDIWEAVFPPEYSFSENSFSH